MVSGVQAEGLPAMYWGRKWDAPSTDDAIEAHPELMALLLPQACNLCQEPMLLEHNLTLLPHLVAHTECLLREMLGDVPHLEGRCLCFGGSDHDERPFRQGALDAVQWLIDHNRGRFHD